MENNSQKTYWPKNAVRLVGYVSSAEIEKGTDTKGPYIRVKKAVFQNNKGVHLLLTGNRIRQYTQAGKIRKDYAALNAARENLKTVKEHGKDGADLVVINGDRGIQDYLGRDTGDLITRDSINVSSIYKLKDSEPNAADLQIEGFIRDIVTNDDGGLRVQLLARTKFGEALPMYFTVLPELADDFQTNLMPEQTALFNLEFRMIWEDAPSSGGIGIQKTKGKSHVDLVCVGTEGLAYPEGKDGYISPEFAHELLAKRAGKLEQLKSEGYQQAAPKTGIPSTALDNDFVGPSDSDELPF